MSPAGWDCVPLEDRSLVRSFPDPLRCNTPPLPPIPPPSPRSFRSPLSPPPSERREFWRVGVPGRREESCPFFSSDIEGKRERKWCDKMSV
ncbi:hypothetical protein AAFF_G00366280 [Aldrovandia affinis]|uniref:Uncharacterized protein n=1 Tax=Aldrovandia affinis TaxID=143900 RepID=A0AAD7SHB0_9TELE|nr:hypothetical protein AAFF_G00366280 [Aldrovandia affinis]